MTDPKRALKWMAFFPLGIILGTLSCGIWMVVADLLFGKYLIPSAIFLVVIGFSWPTATVLFGVKIAPRTPDGDVVPAVRWVLLSPYILFSVLWAFFVITDNPGLHVRETSEQFASLSGYSSALLYGLGILAGTVTNGVTDVREYLWADI